MSHNVEIHQAQTIILRELLFLPNARYTKLRKATNLESDHFKFHLQALVERGFVEKREDGMYQLTPDGKEHANKLDTEANTVERQPKTAVMLLIQHPTKKDQYLFHQRTKHPYYGFWGMMTGKIRWGETIVEAAHRELKEETNLTADIHFRTIFHEHALDESGKILEDKIFFIMYCNNVKGKLRESFEGGRNQYATIKETTEFEKKYNTFDMELKLALGEIDEALVEEQQSYTKDQF